MSQPDCDCGADLGGFHSFSCARYATVEDNWTPQRVRTDEHRPVDNLSPRDGDDPGHSCGAVDDALPRLRALLAETKAMVVRAEAIVASMRDPANYFRKY